MAVFAQNLRFALRQLRRSRGFAAVAVLALALGIGVTAAVCSVVVTVLLRPLPYPDSDALVGVAFSYPYDRPNAEQVGTVADFVRAHSQAFSSMAVMDDSGPAVNLSLSGGHAVQVNSLRVSEGYFRTLGVQPAIGRAFLPAEDASGGPLAVISATTCGRGSSAPMPLSWVALFASIRKVSLSSASCLPALRWPLKARRACRQPLICGCPFNSLPKIRAMTATTTR